MSDKARTGRALKTTLTEFDRRLYEEALQEDSKARDATRRRVQQMSLEFQSQRMHTMTETAEQKRRHREDVEKFRARREEGKDLELRLQQRSESKRETVRTEVERDAIRGCNEMEATLVRLGLDGQSTTTQSAPRRSQSSIIFGQAPLERAERVINELTGTEEQHQRAQQREFNDAMVASIRERRQEDTKAHRDKVKRQCLMESEMEKASANIKHRDEVDAWLRLSRELMFEERKLAIEKFRSDAALDKTREMTAFLVASQSQLQFSNAVAEQVKMAERASKQRHIDMDRFREERAEVKAKELVRRTAKDDLLGGYCAAIVRGIVDIAITVVDINTKKISDGRAVSTQEPLGVTEWAVLVDSNIGPSRLHEAMNKSSGAELKTGSPRKPKKNSASPNESRAVTPSLADPSLAISPRSRSGEAVSGLASSTQQEILEELVLDFFDQVVRDDASDLVDMFDRSAPPDQPAPAEISPLNHGAPIAVCIVGAEAAAMCLTHAKLDNHSFLLVLPTHTALELASLISKVEADEVLETRFPNVVRLLLLLTPDVAELPAEQKKAASTGKPKKEELEESRDAALLAAASVVSLEELVAFLLVAHARGHSDHRALVLWNFSEHNLTELHRFLPSELSTNELVAAASFDPTDLAMRIERVRQRSTQSTPANLYQSLRNEYEADSNLPKTLTNLPLWQKNGLRFARIPFVGDSDAEYSSEKWGNAGTRALTAFIDSQNWATASVTSKCVVPDSVPLFNRQIPPNVLQILRDLRQIESDEALAFSQLCDTMLHLLQCEWTLPIVSELRDELRMNNLWEWADLQRSVETKRLASACALFKDRARKFAGQRWVGVAELLRACAMDLFQFSETEQSVPLHSIVAACESAVDAVATGFASQDCNVSHVEMMEQVARLVRDFSLALCPDGIDGKRSSQWTTFVQLFIDRVALPDQKFITQHSLSHVIQAAQIWSSHIFDGFNDQLPHIIAAGLPVSPADRLTLHGPRRPSSVQELLFAADVAIYQGAEHTTTADIRHRSSSRIIAAVPLPDFFRTIHNSLTPFQLRHLQHHFARRRHQNMSYVVPVEEFAAVMMSAQISSLGLVELDEWSAKSDSQTPSSVGATAASSLNVSSYVFLPVYSWWYRKDSAKECNQQRSKPTQSGHALLGLWSREEIVKTVTSRGGTEVDWCLFCAAGVLGEVGPSPDSPQYVPQTLLHTSAIRENFSYIAAATATDSTLPDIQVGRGTFFSLPAWETILPHHSKKTSHLDPRLAAIWNFMSLPSSKVCPVLNIIRLLCVDAVPLKLVEKRMIAVGALRNRSADSWIATHDFLEMFPLDPLDLGLVCLTAPEAKVGFRRDVCSLWGVEALKRQSFLPYCAIAF